MHTYWQMLGDSHADEWAVGILGSGEDADYHIVRYFKHEIQAISFCNFLNGGSQDITLIKELIDQQPKP